MSHRRHPVPPTYADRLRRLLAVASEHVEPASAYVMRIEHDNGCPALQRQTLAACTCEPWFRPPVKLAGPNEPLGGDMRAEGMA